MFGLLSILCWVFSFVSIILHCTQIRFNRKKKEKFMMKRGKRDLTGTSACGHNNMWECASSGGH